MEIGNAKTGSISANSTPLRSTLLPEEGSWILPFLLDLKCVWQNNQCIASPTILDLPYWPNRLYVASYN